ncbi:MAG: lipase family protein [Acidobacteria bacterium]|nr:lipase family protein [Acidobacteriota bacterium]
MSTFDFDVAAEGHSAKNALRLGEAAAVAYQTGQDIAQWAAERDLDSRFFDEGKIQGFTAQDDRLVLAVFRGTDQLEDWGINLNAAPERPRAASIRGELHSGFYESLLKVWDSRVAPALRDRGVRKVWITGHSLGGALAALAAAQAEMVEGVPVQGLYTYGQPRVGNKAFMDQFNGVLGSRAFRYVNDKDVVPRVPLLAMGYRHAREEMFFLADGKLREDPSLEEKLHNFIASELDRIHDALDFKGDFKALFAKGLEGIQDHSMPDSYLPRLRAAFEGR